MSKSENMHKKQQIHSHILHRMNCSNANLLIYSCYLLSKAAAADDAAKILATQWRRFSLRLLPCTILGRFQRGGCISSPLWCAFFPLFLCRVDWPLARPAPHRTGLAAFPHPALHEAYNQCRHIVSMAFSPLYVVLLIPRLSMVEISLTGYCPAQSPSLRRHYPLSSVL